MLLVLSSVLAGCAATAGDAPTRVVLPAYRVGDALQYAEFSEWTEDGRPVRWTGGVLLEIEGPREAKDKWERSHPTLAVRQDWIDEGARIASSRCHVLAGGVEQVREDILEGLAYRTDNRILGTVESPQVWDIQARAIFYGTCYVFPILAARTLEEGDRLPAAAITSSIRWLPLEGESTAGVATSFEGRPALAFTFAADPAREAPEVRLVVAHGIPGVASIDVAWSADERDHIEVAGYVEGAGEPVRDEGARLPPPPAHVAKREADWMRVDDSAWPLRFRFDDALAAILATPEGGELSAFLESHPRAILRHAFYKSGETNEQGDLVLDGTWSLGYTDGVDAIGCTAARAGSGMGLPVPDALKPVHVNCWGPDARGEAGRCGFACVTPIPERYPAQVAAAESLARTAAMHGIPPEKVINLRYYVLQDADGAFGVLSLEDAPYYPGREVNGTILHLHGGDASLRAVFASRMSTQLAPLSPAASFPAQPAPEPSAGLALAAVGAGAVILGGIVVKLLMMLFTRLVARQLLENPVRARLHERIRADPGISREELIDFVGVGNGATRHHLRKLVGHGYVLEVVGGGVARYYARGEVPPDLARRHAALGSGRARDVYELLQAQPGISLRDAAGRLGMTAPSVYRVKRRLQSAGLLAERNK